MRRIGRRSDDMLIIRGVNVFPSQVEVGAAAVRRGTLPHYQIILTSEHGLDQMEVQVEVTPKIFSDKIATMEALQKRLSDTHEAGTADPRAGDAGGPEHDSTQRRKSQTSH